MLDSYSELSRIRARQGLRITASASASAYIFTAKIRRIVNQEHGSGGLARVVGDSKGAKDKAMTTIMHRLDYIGLELARHAWGIYEDLGVRALILFLLKRKHELKRIEDELTNDNDC